MSLFFLKKKKQFGPCALKILFFLGCPSLLSYHCCSTHGNVFLPSFCQAKQELKTCFFTSTIRVWGSIELYASEEFPSSWPIWRLLCINCLSINHQATIDDSGLTKKNNSELNNSPLSCHSRISASCYSWRGKYTFADGHLRSHFLPFVVFPSPPSPPFFLNLSIYLHHISALPVYALPSDICHAHGTAIEPLAALPTTGEPSTTEMSIQTVNFPHPHSRFPSMRPALNICKVRFHVIRTPSAETVETRFHERIPQRRAHSRAYCTTAP